MLVKMAKPFTSRARRSRRPQQLSLAKTGGWGGRRKGSGRRPQGAEAGVRHRRREPFSRLPLHITLRLRPHVYNLRSLRCYRALHRSFCAAKDRFGMRLCEFSVQGNHLHLVVEADDAACLTRGMRGITIRMARALNRVMQRRVPVFADRFHSRVLRTPTEVRNVVKYVLGNHARHHHLPSTTVDTYTSRGYMRLRLPDDHIPIVRPATWLLRRAVGPPSSDIGV